VNVAELFDETNPNATIGKTEIATAANPVGLVIAFLGEGVPKLAM